MSKVAKNPLEAVITKGLLEDLVEVAGFEVLMHIATVREEQEINKATQNVNLLDRDYERWVHRLSWSVTRVNDHVLEGHKEAYDFFTQLTQPHLEAFVAAYGEMFEKVNKNLGLSVEEVKN